MSKILGGTDPVTQELFKVTRGIGQGENGLAPVDASTSGGNVSVLSENVMSAASLNTQEPGALDVPLQLEFGPAQATAEWDLDAAGNFTCLQADEYTLYLRLSMGRTGSGAVAVMFARILLNGTQIGRTLYARIDDGDDVWPLAFSGTIPFAANDVLTIEIMRSTQGTSAGGVFGNDPSVAGWAEAPSCQLIIDRTLAVAS